MGCAASPSAYRSPFLYKVALLFLVLEKVLYLSCFWFQNKAVHVAVSVAMVEDLAVTVDTNCVCDGEEHVERLSISWRTPSQRPRQPTKG
jgi:hypothetical protein